MIQLMYKLLKKKKKLKLKIMAKQYYIEKHCLLGIILTYITCT